MLPKWFDEWNARNPVDIYRPAIIFGTLGGAVFVVIALWALGQPFATDSLQTGPRGNGMSITKFERALATPDPTIAGIVTSEPIEPTAESVLARDAYEDAEPYLGDLTVENYDRLVGAMRSWTGIPDLFAGEENYQTIVARRMIEMTQYINEEWGAHVQSVAGAGVTCYTCHRGEPVPSDIWFLATPTVERAGGWAAVQNRVTPLSTYTSLPSDALEAYLLNYEVIGVHDLDSRVAGVPGVDGYPGIQHAERTYAFMNYIADALGVNCTFCHNTRAFYDAEQVTPQWGIESLGIGMVQDINEAYLLPLKDEYPSERLGPIHADAPKAACKTCHKGYQRPLQGTNVIFDWPELSLVGAPADDLPEPEPAPEPAPDADPEPEGDAAPEGDAPQSD